VKRSPPIVVHLADVVVVLIADRRHPHHALELHVLALAGEDGLGHLQRVVGDRLRGRFKLGSAGRRGARDLDRGSR
jgi:hypothetical protein